MSRFIDTNILAYAYDKGAGEKYTRAVQLVTAMCKGTERPIISTQVVQELHLQLLRFGYPTVEAIAISRLFMSWRVLSVTPELLERSFEVRVRYDLSVWDSSIVAAAQLAHASELLSEDLQAGQRFDDVVVVNPLK
ncbi:MAG: VapC toxin family PIN domain ribonuclease [Proteobacteria bacterium]|nr:MAG: VapC toxin family PIN domain ribonuclease [Pseudomonadota bacterium]